MSPNLICPECNRSHNMMNVKAERRENGPVWWCPNNHDNAGPFKWADTLEPGYTLGDM